MEEESLILAGRRDVQTESRRDKPTQLGITSDAVGRQNANIQKDVAFTNTLGTEGHDVMQFNHMTLIRR